MICCIGRYGAEKCKLAIALQHELPAFHGSCVQADAVISRSCLIQERLHSGELKWRGIYLGAHLQRVNVGGNNEGHCLGTYHRLRRRRRWCCCGEEKISVGLAKL